MAIIGLVVGFSSKVIAQYGAPPAAFRINGKITSRECNMPIQNLQVVIKSNLNEKADTLYTNSIGEYRARISYWDFDESKHNFTVTVKDKDGKANGGSFSSEKKSIEVKSYVPYELNLKLKHTDTPPCKTSITKDTTDESKPNEILPSDTNGVTANLTLPMKVNKTIQTDEFLLYPNPVTTQFTIEFTSNTSNRTVISISDEIGKVVFLENFNALIGQQKVTIHSLKLPPGNYVVSIIQEANILSKKIIVI